MRCGRTLATVRLNASAVAPHLGRDDDAGFVLLDRKSTAANTCEDMATLTDVDAPGKQTALDERTGKHPALAEGRCAHPARVSRAPKYFSEASPPLEVIE